MHLVTAWEPPHNAFEFSYACVPHRPQSLWRKYVVSLLFFIPESTNKIFKLLSGHSRKKVNKLTHNSNINSYHLCSSVFGLWIYLIIFFQKNLRKHYFRQNFIERTKQNQSVVNPSSAFEFPFLCEKGISNIFFWIFVEVASTKQCSYITVITTQLPVSHDSPLQCFKSMNPSRIFIIHYSLLCHSLRSVSSHAYSVIYSWF